MKDKETDRVIAWIGAAVLAISVMLWAVSTDITHSINKIKPPTVNVTINTDTPAENIHGCLPPLCHITTPTPRPTPSAASRSRVLPTPKPHFTSGLPLALQKVRTCESGDLHNLSSYNYQMQDPTSTASGAFGFLRSTWDNWGGYSQAKYAPPSVQDAKAIATYHLSGLRPWADSRHCWSQL